VLDGQDGEWNKGTLISAGWIVTLGDSIAYAYLTDERTDITFTSSRAAQTCKPARPTATSTILNDLALTKLSCSTIRHVSHLVIYRGAKIQKDTILILALTHRYIQRSLYPEGSTDGGLRLGNIVPDFKMETTMGDFDSFHEWKEGKWGEFILGGRHICLPL